MYLHTAPLFLKPCLIDPWGGNSVSMGFYVGFITKFYLQWLQ